LDGLSKPASAGLTSSAYTTKKKTRANVRAQARQVFKSMMTEKECNFQVQGFTGLHNQFKTIGASTAGTIGGASDYNNPSARVGGLLECIPYDASNIKWARSSNTVFMDRIRLRWQLYGSGTTAWRIIVLRTTPGNVPTNDGWTNDRNPNGTSDADNVAQNTTHVADSYSNRLQIGTIPRGAMAGAGAPARWTADVKAAIGSSQGGLAYSFEADASTTSSKLLMNINKDCYKVVRDEIIVPNAAIADSANSQNSGMGRLCEMMIPIRRDVHFQSETTVSLGDNAYFALVLPYDFRAANTGGAPSTDGTLLGHYGVDITYYWKEY